MVQAVGEGNSCSGANYGMSEHRTSYNTRHEKWLVMGSRRSVCCFPSP
jgi:hypothetical protein